jgi:hypothetical protein
MIDFFFSVPSLINKLGRSNVKRELLINIKRIDKLLIIK